MVKIDSIAPAAPKVWPKAPLFAVIIALFAYKLFIARTSDKSPVSVEVAWQLIKSNSSGLIL